MAHPPVSRIALTPPERLPRSRPKRMAARECEHASMGLELYRPGERIRRLDEACEIYKRLCTQPTTDFDGRYYQLKEARCEPKPVQKPYPPIVIGGGGEKLTLLVTAKHADIWNFGGGTPETLRHKIE